MPVTQNEITQRIEKQTELARTLKNLHYIVSFKIYKDLGNIRLCSLDKIPSELRSEVEVLLTILEMPLLVDDIEELVTNYQRQAIRTEIHKINPELFSFYESNKLQSSNLVMMLTLIKFIDEHSCKLSEEIMEEWENVRFALNGFKALKIHPSMMKLWIKLCVRFNMKNLVPGDHIGALRYKSQLNNEQKLSVAENATRLCENVILEIVKKYEH